MTTLLPNAKQQFFSANGVPLAGGSVYFYIPGTTTFKNTWQDASQIALNTNPVILDAAGEAVIFGVGSYRQVVYDSLSNLIWDQLTASTDTGGIYSGGTSTGTAANQILASTTPAGFSLTSGNQLTFIAGFTSTGATTLNANGTGAKAITKPGSSGPVALTAGDIVVGDAVVVYYDGTQFQLINPVALPLTGGTLSGPLNFAQGADIASAATINLTTATGNIIDITGVVAITAITLQQGAARWVRFTGILTLTNGASLVLPGNANITTAAGDCALFIGYAAGVVRCESYQRFSGLAINPAGIVIVQDRKTTGTVGQTLTQNTYTDRDLNTLLLNTVGGATAVSTPNLTLPAGTYDVTATISANPAGGGSPIRTRLFNTTDAAVQQDIGALDIVSVNQPSSVGSPMLIRARFTIAAQKNLKFQTWNNAVGNTGGLASAGTGNTEPEVYLSAEFVKIA